MLNLSVLRYLCLLCIPLMLVIAVACGGDDEEVATTAAPQAAATTAPSGATSASQPAATAAPQAAAAAATASPAATEAPASAPSPAQPAQPRETATPLPQAPSQEQPQRQEAVPTATPRPTPLPSLGEVVVPRLRHAISSPGQETNRTWQGTRQPYAQYAPMLDNLIAMDPETAAIVPGLAESWDISEDLSEWTFHLRPGVPFHGGWGEFTATDVRYSIERLCHPETRLSTCRYLAGPAVDVEEGWHRLVPLDQVIEEIDDYTVRTTFHNTDGEPVPLAWGEFIWSIRSNELAIESSAQFYAEGVEGLDNNGIVGTGPYQYRERNVGSSLIVERKPEEDWAGRLTDFDEYEILWIPEDATRYAALQQGEIHMTDLPLDLQADARDLGFGQVYSKFASRNVFLLFGGMHFSDTPESKAGYDPNQAWNKLNVRKAMNLAINREEMGEFLYPGVSEPMYVGNYHPTQPGWDPTWPERYETEYKYNPEKAKELLAQEGYGPDNPVKVKAMSYASPGEAETPQIMEAICTLYWAQVDIDCELVDMDSGTAVGRWIARDTVGWVWVNIIGYFPQDYWLTIAYTSSSFIHHYEDDFLDAKIDEIQNIRGREAHDQAIQDVGNYFFDNHIEAPLYWFRQSYVYDAGVIEDWIWPGLGQISQYLHTVTGVRK